MKRGSPLRRYKQLERKTPLRSHRAALPAHSDKGSPVIKERIQALLRAIVAITDGGCILRHYRDELPPQFRDCGTYTKDGVLVLQAEHLITRSNSVSYADLRNIVCLCSRHHGDFKPQHGRLYWDIVRRYIGEERWAWLKSVEAEYSSHKTHRFYESDWLKIEAYLKSKLRSLEPTHPAVVELMQ